jgi:hypothetical protein
MKLEPDGVVAEPAARQARPADRVLSLLEVLLGRAPMIVERDDTLGGAAQVGHDGPYPRVQLAWMPLHLGDDVRGFSQLPARLGEAGVMPAHLLGRRPTGRFGRWATLSCSTLLAGSPIT